MKRLKKILSVICILIILFSQFAVVAVELEDTQDGLDKIPNNQSENKLEEDVNFFNDSQNEEIDENNENDKIEKNNNEIENDEGQIKNEFIEANEIKNEENEKVNNEEERKENQILQNLEQSENLHKESANNILTSSIDTKSNIQIPSGVYKLRSALNKNFVLDISGGGVNNGDNVQIWTSANVKQQRFYITNLGDGYYTIIAIHSSKALDVAGAGKTNGTNIWQYESNGTDAQKWRIIEDNNGGYMFQSKCNGLYLDISGGFAQNGSNIQVYQGNGTNAQKFFIERVDNIERNKVLEEGTYIIKLANKQNKVFDIDGGRIESGANLQIWEDSKVKQQQFEIAYLGDGYYEIKAKHSAKVLDVSGGIIDNGTNVWQYESNGSDAQKWIIRKTSDGFYTIISKLSGSYLQVESNFENGSNVQICDVSEEKYAQKYVFEKYKLKSEKVIEDGIYKIRSVLNANFVFDISAGSKKDGANLQIWSNSNVMQQQFKFTYSKDGYYTITAMHSSKVLDVDNSGKTNGTNIWQYESNGTSAQKWILKKDEKGYYSIISQCNELYIDISGGIAINGTNIQMYEGNNSNAQKFILEKYEEFYIIEDNEYEINTLLKNDMVLDVSGGSNNNKANIQIWNYTNVQQQMFEFKYQNNGYYIIKAKHSGKVFEVENSKNNGSNVYQSELNGSDRQLWKIEFVDNGKYRIKSKFNNLYLDVSEEKNINGTNVQVWQYAETNAQIFKLRTVKTLNGIDVSKHQGIINWNSVKNQGIDFAILRIGYGKDDISQDDQQFKRNVSECERLKIPYGVYIYSYALKKEDTDSEVNHVLRMLDGRKPNLGVWIDMEDADGYKERNGGIISENCIQICEEFCKQMKQKGYDAGIYASKDWFETYLNDARLENNRRWVAQWNKTCTYTNSYDMWQYKDDGIIDGIFGNVDMDYYYLRTEY